MHTVLLFYKYVTIADPQALVEWVRERAEHYKLRGRCLVAQEGINGTFEGLEQDAEAFAAELLAREPFTDMNIKRSRGTGNSFPKLAVRQRNEIVGTRFSKEDADPEHKTAPHMPPEELKALYEQDADFVVIDMRNDYEFSSGHFKNSINPVLSAARDLPQALSKLEPYKNKKVITVCTGGVRCEKMAAYLMSHGFSDVSQLENGIHAYMEKYPGEDFLGTLYTFDQRVVMDFGGPRQIIGKCHHCNTPTEQYVNCANYVCHLHFLVCDACKSTEGRTYCSEHCKITDKITA
ncbi:MAG: rhodanese-related sulfurtransferase [Candidatus Pacebacteria bacterium]|nr:rhodanese-related sulfurtransferase [Candidatus Paceibacterota bacterium]